MRLVALFALLIIPATANAQNASAAESVTIPVDSEYAPRHRLQAGPERVAYFIGGSFCVPSNRPEVVAAMRRAKVLLARQAASDSVGFSVVGVALDWDVADGMKYLAKLGALDQVSAGGNWLNALAVDRIWGDTTSTPSTPQIIIIEHTVALADRITVSNARVIQRIVGGDEIADWVARGAPVPASSPR